jgi:low temperature requirement protein LtrA
VSEPTAVGAELRGDAPAEPRVTTLELFTDLVFVFAITQLTTLLTHDQTPRGVLEVLLIFGVLWWMFGGYVWLTNTMSLEGKVRRLLLLVAMMGFLVIALAIPTAFHGGGVFFGLGYLIVVIVHAGLFTYARGGRLADIARFAPMNLVGVLLILTAGFVPETAYLFFALALAGQVASSVLSARGITIRIRAGHFVERHGLLVLIVLGESVVVIGVGAAGLALESPLIVAALLALAITSALWWLYFSGDDLRAEHALATTPADRQVAIALGAFFYSTIPMLLGVVAFAAGVKSAIAHASEHVTIETALSLSVGVALYLMGEAMFRRWIGSDDVGRRLLAAAACLTTTWIGTTTSAWVEMLAILAVLVALIAVDARQAFARSSDL